MPGKSRYPADEYESDDFEHAETLSPETLVQRYWDLKYYRESDVGQDRYNEFLNVLCRRLKIGRNRAPVAHTKKKPRPSSATKNKPPRRPGTPGKKKRVSSAPSAKTGHDLWMNAVKSRMTVGLSSNRHPPSPRHKTSSEYWMETLRRTGQGRSTESTGMNTFNNKRPYDKDMPYLSTPSYLRQKVGTERAPRGGSDPMAKPAPGTPNYKSPEEYYEQILEYKKQVSSMTQDGNTMKAKIRRLEEDNLKKEKEIDVLLNPHKSEELRRTLADKKPDSGSVIHSLKQKILKLETQMRDKETSYIKLQSDLKTTKVEELKSQLEVFYQEIVRLQHSKDTGIDKSARGMSKDGTIKVKALNETILRLNKSNEQLQNENRALKDDLKNSIDSHRDGHVSREYEDMNRSQLLKSISQLERRVEKAERYTEGSSVVSYDTRSSPSKGKIALEGSVEERLDQLDKRESELMVVVEKKSERIRQLTDERNRWKRRCEELESMLTSGHVDHPEYVTDSKVERSRQKSPSVSSGRPPSSRPMSARRDRDRPMSARSESDRPPSARERSGSRADRPLSGKMERGSRPPSASRRKSSIDSGVSSVRNRRVKEFKENRSAKIIQKNWKAHTEQKKTRSSEVKMAAPRIEANTPQQRLHPHSELHYSGTPTHVNTHSPNITTLMEDNMAKTAQQHKQDKHRSAHVAPANQHFSKQTHINTQSPNKTIPMKDEPAKTSPPHKQDKHKPGHNQTAAAATAGKPSTPSKKLESEKVQNFRKNHAAKTIQKKWTNHQYKKQMHEKEEASELIYSSLMGHNMRQRQMQQHQFSTDEDEYETEDEEYNNCVSLIQSSMQGHNTRRSRMKEYTFSSTGEDDYDDDDDDIMETPKRRLSSSLRSNSGRPQSGKSRSSFSSSLRGSGGIRSGTTSSYNTRGHSSSQIGDDNDF